MTAVCLWVLGVATAFVLYTYAGYPVALLVLAAVRHRRPPFPPLAEWPPISIVVPAYNEAAAIQTTLDNLLQVDYPAERRQIVVLSDASTDATDAIVAAYASRGVELVRLPRRSGKTAVENAALPLLRGEIIVNTDASVRVERGAVKRLVATFADPTVGVASSHNVSVARLERHANYAESWYVRYDMWVRDLESRVSGIVGAAGCLYAVRASIHRHVLPGSMSRDFAAGLVARERGFRALSVPDAVCFVPRIPSLRREYRRKVRTIARGIETLVFKRHLLNPVRFGLFAWILASRKVCRWLIPHVGALALPALLWLAATVPGAWWGVAPVAVAAACAAGAWWWPEQRPLPRLVALPAYFVMGNLAALQASLRTLRRDLHATWEPTRRVAVAPGGGVTRRRAAAP